MNDLQIPVGESTESWLRANGFGQLSDSRLIGGNARNHCYVLSNAKNEKIVAKISSSSAEDVFEKEAHGLSLLAASGAIRTPMVLHVTPQCLLMEYISESRQGHDYWTTLATQLASLHQHTVNGAFLDDVGGEPPQGPIDNSSFGLEHNNYCGDNQQVNGWFDDGHEFFSDQRLLYQARMAFDNGYLESPWVIHIESICERLTELIPAQPSSLLHGDLWPGNILSDERGQPALIDPAVYYGWREADIAMTLLFGGLPHEFYLAYDEAWPMEPRWRSRVPLYNLYHLLNHLNIFGVSYLEQVQGTISRYA